MSSSIFLQSSSGLRSKPDYRSKTLPFNPIFDVSFSRNKINPSSVAFNISLRLQKSNKTKRNFVVYNSVEAGNPLPSGPPSGGAWKSWVIGIVISVILPLLSGQVTPLLLIKNKFDTALQSIETVVETVEKVAGTVEKVAEDALDHLPDGRLKKAVAVLEHIAERANRDADRLDDLIDEVQEKGEKLEDCIEAVAEKKEAEESSKEVKVNQK